MAYTKDLLGFRDLQPEELSAVAGGFFSPPGVGGGGTGGINFSLSPDRSILSVSGSTTAEDGTTFKNTYDFTTQDPSLKSVDFSLIAGDQSYTASIDVQNDSLGETFQNTFDDGSSVTITFTEGADGSETAVVTWNRPF